MKILRVSAVKISFETGASILQVLVFSESEGVVSTPSTTIHRGPFGLYPRVLCPDEFTQNLF